MDWSHLGQSIRWGGDLVMHVGGRCGFPYGVYASFPLRKATGIRRLDKYGPCQFLDGTSFVSDDRHCTSVENERVAFP
jgi:hypothetical protein